MKQIYNPMFSQRTNWIALNQKSIGRRMIWYMASFKTPVGIDPVVLDMQGMGKGQAWVNGQSIGAYNPSKCVGNCGNPSKRWYHVSRSFLSSNTNTLILFEEIGRNPQHVSVQTITIGTICENAKEGSTLELSCQGGLVISDIQFASYGNPEGKCGSFKQDSWDVTNSSIFVEKFALAWKVVQLMYLQSHFN
ncbi:hypothetical protein IC582_028640 [Cucumis melo]